MKKFAEKFMPKKPVVLDLDAIVNTSQYVKFQDKVHEIKPIHVNEFFALANAMAYLEEVKAEKAPTLPQVIEAYHGIISAVCPTVTKEMIRAASHAQIAQLIQLVMEHVSGKITDEKKKTMVSLSWKQMAN